MTKTYSIVNPGSFGPAHPMHNPEVIVTLFEDGAKVRSSRQPCGRDGHLWALEQGYVPPADSSAWQSAKFQELLAEVRYRNAGL